MYIYEYGKLSKTRISPVEFHSNSVSNMRQKGQENESNKKTTILSILF